MTFLSDLLKQDAILWSRTGTDASGQPSWAAPTGVKAHWEDETQEFLAPNGERRQIVAKVWISVDVGPGDMLSLGTYNVITTPTNPRLAASAEVLRADKVADVAVTEFMRVAYVGAA